MLRVLLLVTLVALCVRAQVVPCELPEPLDRYSPNNNQDCVPTVSAPFCSGIPPNTVNGSIVMNGTSVPVSADCHQGASNANACAVPTACQSSYCPIISLFNVANTDPQVTVFAGICTLCTSDDECLTGVSSSTLGSLRSAPPNTYCASPPGHCVPQRAYAQQCSRNPMCLSFDCRLDGINPANNFCACRIFSDGTSDCPSETPICDSPGTGRCVQCTGNPNCPAGQFCDNNTCVILQTE